MVVEMPIFKRRRRKLGLLNLLLLSILLLSVSVSSVPCDDNRCKTGSCDDDGTCICNLPDPSTIFDGDSGRFCDEEQIMCDGTSSFWCEHGSRCEEIVHGENYTCKCQPGYIGEHCQHSGAPCGKIFCFHQAACLIEGDVCECPPNWKGSVDCSLPTESKTDGIVNSTASKSPSSGDNHSSMKGIATFLVVACTVGAAVGAVLYFKRLKKKETSPANFQELSQLQVRDFLEEEEDASLVAHKAQRNNGRGG